MAEYIFYISIVFIIYPYIIYPTLLFIGAYFFSKNLLREECTDYKLSIIIPIYNAAEMINDKIEAIKKIDYPIENIEIIFVSDGSTDETSNVFKSLKPPFIRCFELEKRSGKSEALNYGVSKASYDFLVFFDIRQTYDSQILKQLTLYFTNSSVNAVTGDIKFKAVKGSDIYWLLETYIRDSEGRLKSTVNVSGANYCMRKDSFVPFPKNIILDDLFEPLSIAAKGGRVIFNAKAIAFDDNYQATLAVEEVKKTRTLSGNFDLLFTQPQFLNPSKNQAWFQYYSHKVLRLFVPCFMMILYIDSLILFSDSVFYAVAFTVQTVIYSLFIIDRVSSKKLTIAKFFKIPFLFIRLNEYIIRGFISYIKSNTLHLW